MNIKQRDKIDKLRSSHENYCRDILKKIKPLVKAFVFDFDGTIKSSSEPECLPLELIKKIVLSGRFVGIVTASGVSALSGLAEQIVNLNSENNFLTPIYLGIANGVALYKLDGHEKHELYSYPLAFDEVSNIVRVWESVMNKNKIKEVDLMEKGLVTFNKFLEKDWGEYVLDDFLSLSKKFSGKCFMEKLKATFIMPKNEIFSQEKFIIMMQEEIDSLFGNGKFIIDMGDTIFAHVTYRPNMAPKLFTLNRIRKELELKEEQILTFGNLPFGNDKGLLIDSHLPYTFTNKYFNKENIEKPPFILPESEFTPVGSVYKAILYLIEK